MKVLNCAAPKSYLLAVENECAVEVTQHNTGLVNDTD